jgi:hypothetical protein
MASVLDTVESLEEQIDMLRCEAHDVSDEMKSLCDECPSIRVMYEPEEYHGFLCRRPVPECPVHFECGASGCCRGGEYEKLEECCNAILREIGQLVECEVRVFNGEVA